MTTKILIAEDNAINQRVMQLLLAKAGYQSDLVDNGEAAVQACAETPYDLVLMDCHMPRMDGMTATRLIRRLDIAQPAIIAVTARALRGDREDCLESGMDDYLSKPFQSKALLDLIRVTLEHKIRHLTVTA